MTPNTTPEFDIDPSARADRAALERARTVATLTDDAFRVPGTSVRFGLDPILGIAPVSGDLVAAAVSLYVVFKGVQIGVPTRSVLAMLGRVAVDLAVGSIPVLGTLLDAAWKANERNVQVIEAHVAESG
ncbi:MAG: DUF4112 domain-containing protein [Halosimplex sp.]